MPESKDPEDAIEPNADWKYFHDLSKDDRGNQEGEPEKPASICVHLQLDLPGY